MPGNENIWLSLSELLERKIRSGIYRGRLPGIRKFASSLGVHPVTLRKALRNLERKQLVTVCDRRGTFVSTCPRRPEYRTIMFVNGSSLVTRMPRVLEMLKMRRFKHLALFFQEEQFWDNPGFLRNFPVDGFVFTLSSLYAPTVSRLQAANIPFVSTDGWREPDEISFVSVDNHLAITTMLKKLRERGHRKVAFFNSPRTPEYQFFLEEVRHSFEEIFGEDFSQDLFMTDLDLRELSTKGDRESFVAASRIYLRRCARSKEPPTAFLLIDQWCQAVRDILPEAGFQIPREISIAGSVRFIEPENFSTAFFDNEEICCAALEQLFRLLDDPGTKSICRRIPPRFLPGETIAPVTAPDLEKWRRLL